MSDERLVTLSPGEFLRMKLEARRIRSDAPRLTPRAARDFVARSEGFTDWGAAVRAVHVDVQEHRP